MEISPYIKLIILKSSNIWIFRLKSNQIKSNQIKSNQIKSNQIKFNQMKSKGNNFECDLRILLMSTNVY